jgi:hypothetical protein
MMQNAKSMIQEVNASIKLGISNSSFHTHDYKSILFFEGLGIHYLSVSVENVLKAKVSPNFILIRIAKLTY